MSCWQPIELKSPPGRINQHRQRSCGPCTARRRTVRRASCCVEIEEWSLQRDWLSSRFLRPIKVTAMFVPTSRILTEFIASLLISSASVGELRLIERVERCKMELFPTARTWRKAQCRACVCVLSGIMFWNMCGADRSRVPSDQVVNNLP